MRKAIVKLIVKLCCGVDLDKIRRDYERLIQENEHLTYMYKQQEKQAKDEKKVSIHEYERLKRILSELSQTSKAQSQKLQEECDEAKRKLNMSISSIISIVKFCDFTLLSDNLKKKDAVREILNQLEMVLNQNNVHSITEVGVDFNETMHKINEVIDTNDEAQNMKVCSSLKRGFRKGNQCIEPQEVNIIRKR